MSGTRSHASACTLTIGLAIGAVLVASGGQGPVPDGPSAVSAERVDTVLPWVNTGGQPADDWLRAGIMEAATWSLDALPEIALRTWPLPPLAEIDRTLAPMVGPGISCAGWAGTAAAAARRTRVATLHRLLRAGRLWLGSYRASGDRLEITIVRLDHRGNVLGCRAFSSTAGQARARVMREVTALAGGEPGAATRMPLATWQGFSAALTTSLDFGDRSLTSLKIEAAEAWGRRLSAAVGRLERLAERPDSPAVVHAVRATLIGQQRNLIVAAAGDAVDEMRRSVEIADKAGLLMPLAMWGLNLEYHGPLNEEEQEEVRSLWTRLRQERPGDERFALGVLWSALRGSEFDEAVALARELVQARDPQARWVALRVLSLGGSADDAALVRGLERDPYARIAAHAAFVRAKLEALATASTADQRPPSEAAPRSPIESPHLAAESGGQVLVAAVSPDGGMLATDHEARVWFVEAGSGRTLCDPSSSIDEAFAARGWGFTWKETLSGLFVDFAPDSRWALISIRQSGEETTRLAVLDLGRCRVRSALEVPGEPRISLGPGGHRLFVAAHRGKGARLVAADSGEVIAEFPTDLEDSGRIAWVPQTGALIFEMYRAYIVVDGSAKAVRRSFARPEDQRLGRFLAVSDDGTQVVLGRSEPGELQIRVIALANGQEIWRTAVPAKEKLYLGEASLSGTLLNFSLDDFTGASSVYQFWEARLPGAATLVGSSSSVFLGDATSLKWLPSGKGFGNRLGQDNSPLFVDARAGTKQRIAVPDPRRNDEGQPTIVASLDSEALAIVDEEAPTAPGSPTVVWVGPARQFWRRPSVTPREFKGLGTDRWGMAADGTLFRIPGPGGKELWTWGPVTDFRERLDRKPAARRVEEAESLMSDPSERVVVPGRRAGAAPSEWHVAECADSDTITMDDGEIAVSSEGITECTLGLRIDLPSDRSSGARFAVDRSARSFIAISDDGVGTHDLLTGRYIGTADDQAPAEDLTRLEGGGAGGLWARWDDALGKQRIEIRRAPSDELVCTITTDAKFQPTQASFVMKGRVFAWNADGRVQFWKADGCEPLPELRFPEAGVWIAIDADGRFDSNDIDAAGRWLQWVRPDAPSRGWPIELFARTYFEPGLLARRLAGERLPVLPTPADLNPALPDVTITDVAPVPGADGRVRVVVHAAAGRAVIGSGPTAKTWATAVHDLKLLRNGLVVAGEPLAGGRLDLGSSGERDVTFEIAAAPDTADPRSAASMKVSAYAFNDDGVRSRAFSREIPASAVRRGRRAFVVSIGINATGIPKLDLLYAASDARETRRALVDALTRSRLYERVASVALVSERLDDGQMRTTATRDHIRAVIDRLVGRDADARLLADIDGAAALARSGPDDLVVITWAGHGVTDARGRYYLLPSDLSGAALSDAGLAGAVSSDDLAQWLLPLDAAAAALVVDACHGGAAVGSTFKPAPLGPRGLGQLAYDKGLRVLVASQADEVATESGTLKRGVLTHALITEGLVGGVADAGPKDGAITLTEWLVHARDRVPALLDRVLGAKGPRPDAGAGWTIAPSTRAVQRPVLFDFRTTGADATVGRVAVRGR